MLLSPSTIHFMQGEKVGLSQGLDSAVLELSLKIVESGNCPPKIQVVEKDGHWFALNNSQLHVYRSLERQGRCTHVKADVVALNDVPVDVRLLMVLPKEDHGANPPIVDEKKDKAVGIHQQMAEGAEGSETERGYHKLQQAEPTEKPQESDEAVDDEDDDDDSSDIDSDSECDWSQDGDSSDCDSSNDDGENSTDDERECLL